MADRRTDDTPLAPRRSLKGPPKPAENAGGQESNGSRRPMTERVSAALTTAGSAVSSAVSSGNGPQGSAAAGTRRESPPASDRVGTPMLRSSGSRKARLRLVHLDPWSVMKTSFLLSIAFGIVTVVSVAVVWSVLGAAGVWDSINKTVGDVLGNNASGSFDVQNYVGASRVMGFTMIVAVLDVVLITAISTLGAFLYNLSAALLGGVEVTLAEDDH